MNGGGGSEYQEEKSSPIFTGKAKGGTLERRPDSAPAKANRSKKGKLFIFLHGWAEGNLTPSALPTHVATTFLL